MPPNWGLAPSAAWRALPDHLREPPPPRQPRSPIPEHCQKSQGGGGREGGGEGRALAGGKGPPVASGWGCPPNSSWGQTHIWGLSILGLCQFFWDFPDFIGNFPTSLGLLKDLQGTFPKGSGTQSGPFPKKMGNTPVKFGKV